MVPQEGNNICIAETWLSGKILKEDGIRSVFSNHQICRADRDNSLRPHQEDDEQTNREGYIIRKNMKGYLSITITDNTLPAKMKEQYFNGVNEP